MAGPERKSRVIDPKEREVIAVHEAGHAVVGELLEHCDPVHKVTILPRGMSLGSTWSLPDKDSYLVNKQELLDDVTALLGGRVAEEVVFNDVTTGASHALQRVTAIARAMVTEFGMSEKLGTLAIGRRQRNPFLGRDFVEDRDYSEEVARQIDDEVRSIVEHCRQRATELITQHRGTLDDVVKALLERETLNREEFLAIMEGRPMPERAVEDSEGQKEEVEAGAQPTERPTPGTSPRLEPGTA
jgi:cell division protease FtsH